ncbi:MAG: M24 family metallopeptidase [Actinomycetota bacterium]
MDHALRRKQLADALTDASVDAFLVTRLPNVRYLAGYTGSNGQLLLFEGDARFFTDSRYEEQAKREVPDVERIIYAGEFVNALRDALLASAGIRRLAFETSGITFKTYEQVREIEPLELVPLEDAVERLRWSKDDEEIKLIQRAQRITDEAFDRVLGSLREGVTERDVAFDLEVAMRRAGAERVAFDAIVAFGENAAEPHHRPSARKLMKGDVVKLDFGCVVDGYHSDMTRTIAFGEPDPRLREIHDLVRKAHEAGALAVRTGAEGGTCDAAARAVITDAGHGSRFGHGLGHGVGLEIHEGPTLRKEGTDVLPENAVVTVEPGVYVPGLGGVRIEDMVVVGEDGCRPLPKTTKEFLVL